VLDRELVALTLELPACGGPDPVAVVVELDDHPHGPGLAERAVLGAQVGPEHDPGALGERDPRLVEVEGASHRGTLPRSRAVGDRPGWCRIVLAMIARRSVLLLLGFLHACAPTPVPVTGAPAEGARPTSASGSGAIEAAPPGPGQQLLEAHNHFRARHCASPLSWSPALAQTAQAWAARLARRGCPLEHSGGSLGENLASATTGTMRDRDVVGLWYGEVSRYNFRRGSFSAATGHFTQLVWRESARLGCAIATCAELQLWVCNYDPPGSSRAGARGLRRRRRRRQRRRRRRRWGRAAADGAQPFESPALDQKRATGRCFA
jgi:uncharacterized protein YkwD